MNLARIGLSLIVGGALLFSGCATTSTSTSQTAPDSQVLRVGIAPDLPPLAFKTGSDYKGVDPDLARALAADLGKTVKFVEVPWDGLVDALLKGKADILMSGMSITQERLMRINYTQPYLKSGQTILVRMTDASLIQMSLFQAKTRVGAQKGTTGDFWVRQNCPNTQRKLYSSATQGAKALVAKQIDAFICDAPVNWWLASEYETSGLTVVGGYLTEEYLGWGVRRDDTELLQSANRFIQQSQTNGTLKSIVLNWIPYR